MVLQKSAWSYQKSKYGSCSKKTTLNTKMKTEQTLLDNYGIFLGVVYFHPITGAKAAWYTFACILS